MMQATAPHVSIPVELSVTGTSQASLPDAGPARTDLYESVSRFAPRHPRGLALGALSGFSLSGVPIMAAGLPYTTHDVGLNAAVGVVSVVGAGLGAVIGACRDKRDNLMYGAGYFLPIATVAVGAVVGVVAIVGFVNSKVQINFDESGNDISTGWSDGACVAAGGALGILSATLAGVGGLYLMRRFGDGVAVDRQGHARAMAEMGRGAEIARTNIARDISLQNSIYSS